MSPTIIAALDALGARGADILIVLHEAPRENREPGSPRHRGRRAVQDRSEAGRTRDLAAAVVSRPS
jgi:hypothetical protein